MTNKEVVLDHLKKYGDITTWEAFRDYGITRLSAVIFELRKEHNIESITEKGKNRRGRKITWTKYVIKKKRWFKRREK